MVSEIDPRKILRSVFNEMGAKPEHLAVNVLLGAGDSVLEMYLIPGREQPYFTEEQARKDLNQGETIYRVTVQRIV